jgi:hypothetical protein
MATGGRAYSSGCTTTAGREGRSARRPFLKRASAQNEECGNHCPSHESRCQPGATGHLCKSSIPIVGRGTGQTLAITSTAAVTNPMGGTAARSRRPLRSTGPTLRAPRRLRRSFASKRWPAAHRPARVAAGWGRSKPPAFVEASHPDVELVVPPSMPYRGGVFRGAERIVRWFSEDLWEMWADFSSTPTDFIDRGDTSPRQGHDP